jgi:hypothetical protein
VRSVGCVAALAVCFVSACGTDQQGTASVHGADAGLEDSAVGAHLSDGGVASHTDGAGSGGDGAMAGTPDGGALAATDASSDGTGTASSDGGAGTGTGIQDGATTDAVAVLSADGGVLCGPCSQGQQCDPALGCVDCTMDSQCPASARYCVLGSCVQCRANTDCGGTTTPSCWPSDHTCHAACTGNQQCQNGNAAICNTSTGACVGCSKPADCAKSQSVCDSTTQQCVQCSSPADCAGTSTPACARNHCVQCASNADCSGTRPYCASGGDNPWMCVQCIQNAQCPSSTPNCNGGTCSKPGG